MFCYKLNVPVNFVHSSMAMGPKKLFNISSVMNSNLIVWYIVSVQAFAIERLVLYLMKKKKN